jgi:hypothetical protein
MSQHVARIRRIFEILVSIDFTRFDLGRQGYFSRESADAREVGSTIELYCREIQNIINSNNLGYPNFLEELQQIWNEYQPIMNSIRRTRHYKSYEEYLDDRYWPEYDYRTFLFIESINNYKCCCGFIDDSAILVICSAKKQGVSATF